MLSAVADGEAIRYANRQAAALRHGVNEILAREHIAWKVYGEHSDWKIFFGADRPPRDGADQSVEGVDWRRLDAKDAARSKALRQALILHGVDYNGARDSSAPATTMRSSRRRSRPSRAPCAC